jgi:two-component system, chemotaxis family, protein-glutamate methylesterase/glutaminase
VPLVPLELVVVGTSWGGLHAVGQLLSDLPPDFEPPVVIAQHRHPDSQQGTLQQLLQQQIARPVVEAEDKLAIEPRRVYVAPADYHLLVERGRFTLSVDDRVRYARPSIDVLFESAADVYGERLIGIILTGANDAGAHGLARIKELGGVALIQDPSSATKRAMPDAAIAATVADAILPLEEIGAYVHRLWAHSRRPREAV